MALSTEFGTYHLADNPDMFEPVRTNNFRFLVYGLEDLLVLGGDEDNDDDYIRNAQEVIDFSVVSFEAPHFTQAKIDVSRGNSDIHYAGKATFGNDKSLVINDFVGANGKSILEAWQALSYNPVDDTIPRASEYKKRAVILEYTADNKLIRYWDMYGCWVSGIQGDSYSNKDASIKQITATITYDRAIPHLAD